MPRKGMTTTEVRRRITIRRQAGRARGAEPGYRAWSTEPGATEPPQRIAIRRHKQAGRGALGPGVERGVQPPKPGVERRAGRK